MSNNKTDSPLQQRDSWGSRWGFIMAAIGSAVGMGNIWLFPYRMGQFGGAAFLIPYIVCVVVLGFTGIVGEVTLGRTMGTGPLGSFRKAVELRGGNPKLGEAIGLIPVIGSLGVAIGYSVVIGWIIRFFAGSITGSAFKAESSEAYFGSIAGHFGSIPWQLIGLALTFVIMVVGISAGIEKVNKFMMPAFFLMFIILAVRVAFLPGSSAGYKFMFIPEWEYVLQPKTWVYALGQAFFSLSLAGSGTVVYGSYLSKNEDIISSARTIAIFDTIAATLSALVIIPACLAFGQEVTSGPPLMFIVMPGIFKSIPLGQIFMIIFFIAVLFAGITSLINLFETPIEALQEKLKLSRAKSVMIIAAIAVIVGVCIEGIVSGWMDVISIYIIPLGALLAAIMVYWVAGPTFARENAQQGRAKKIGKWFEPMTKFVFCGVTIIVYIMGILWGGIG